MDSETDAGADSADNRSHARGVPSCPTVRERVAYIVGLMERLEWDKRFHTPLLAERWGLAESTIQNYSAEASRFVTGDSESARRDITAGCRKLMRQALEDGSAKDFKAVGELLALVSGAKAPERHEVTAGVAASPAEAARLVRSAFGEKAAPKTEASASESGDVPESPAGG